MELVRGQRRPFIEVLGPSFDVEIDLKGVERTTWRVLCLMLGDNERVIDAHGVLYHDSQRSQCGAVVPRVRDPGKATFAIDVTRVAPGIKSLVFAIAFDTQIASRTMANKLAPSLVRLTSPQRHTIDYRFSGADFGEETAIVLLEVYRKDPWRLMAVGSGFLGGAPAMLHRYGVSPEVVQSVQRGQAPLVVAPTNAIKLPTGWPGGLAPRVPAGLLSAVAMVLVQDADGQGGTGTAFGVNPGGFFITCAHVVDNATQVGIVLEGTSVIRPAEVVALDSKLDAALLLLADRNGLEQWFRLCEVGATLELGQEVGILGYPLGSSLGMNVTYSNGIVNSLRRRPETQTQVLQVDVGAAPGSSGAPVFNRADGTVLGILSSGLTVGAGIHVNFAVDLRNVMRLGWFES